MIEPYFKRRWLDSLFNKKEHEEVTVIFYELGHNFCGQFFVGWRMDDVGCEETHITIDSGHSVFFILQLQERERRVISLISAGAAFLYVSDDVFRPRGVPACYAQT